MQKKLNLILRIATFSKFRADILEALGLSLAGGFDWVSFSILARFGIARAKIWFVPRFYINSNFPRYEFWYLYKTSTCKVMNHITRFYSSTRTNTFFWHWTIDDQGFQRTLWHACSTFFCHDWKFNGRSKIMIELIDNWRILPHIL